SRVASGPTFALPLHFPIPGLCPGEHSNANCAHLCRGLSALSVFPMNFARRSRRELSTLPAGIERLNHFPRVFCKALTKCGVRNGGHGSNTERTRTWEPFIVGDSSSGSLEWALTQRWTAQPMDNFSPAARVSIGDR